MRTSKHFRDELSGGRVGFGVTRFAARSGRLNVFWHTPEGKPASIGVISKISMSANEYTETLIAFALDDGSGNPVAYNFSGETKTAAATRENGRISYKLPFDPPAVVYEGDKLTATLEGAFVDYWERVK